MKRTFSMLLLSVSLAACSDGGKQHQPPNQPVTTAASSAVQTTLPTYTVGSQLTYPPFHFQNERGEAMGFEMELLQAVAKAGGFNVNIRNTPRKAMEQTLDDDSIQIWSSTVSISPERSEKMDFSQPFMRHDRKSIYILDNDENKQIKNIEQLKGKKIAINEFSANDKEIVGKITGSIANAVITPSYHLSMNSLYTNKVDGVLDNELVLINYLKNQTNAPSTRRLTVSDEAKDYAFAVKKGNQVLLNKINQGLERVKADGTYQKLVEKWFGNIEL